MLTTDAVMVIVIVGVVVDVEVDELVELGGKRGRGGGRIQARSRRWRFGASCLPTVPGVRAFVRTQSGARWPTRGLTPTIVALTAETLNATEKPSCICG